MIDNEPNATKMAAAVRLHHRRVCILVATFAAFASFTSIYYFFNSQVKSSIETEIIPEIIPAPKVTRDTLSLLSLNIWFGKFKMAERMEAIGRTIESLQPDIIALQEVTNHNLALLKTQEWFKHYTLVHPDDSSNPSYFAIILSKVRVIKSRNIHYKTSRMGRSLLLAQLQIILREASQETPIPSIPFTIATSHLESMDYSSLEREKQLGFSLKTLADFSNVCIMGDLNLEPKADGEILLPQPWFDAWLSISGHFENNGYTWDVSRNPYAKINEPDVAVNRFDRVLCKLTDFGIQNISIVTTDPTGEYFSDHFALYTELEVGLESGSAKNTNPGYKLEFKRPPDRSKGDVTPDDI